ncbi:MAG: hypothetical protein PHU77_00375 [Simplicispira sp.]|nr:hypothetical protein [Simplicispira sp.]
MAAIEAMRAAIGALLNEFGDRNWQSGHGVSYESIEDAFEAIIERAALAAPAQSNLITIRKIATQAEAQMTDTNTLAPTDQSRAEFEIAWRSAEFQEACPYSSSKEVAFAIFKIARRAPAPASQPVAVPAGFKPGVYLFQHEETGLTQFVDAQQVEWGFEKNNPRLKNIGPVFTAAQVQAMLAAAAPTGPAREPLTAGQVWDLARSLRHPAPHECTPVLLTGPGVDYKLFRSPGQSAWVHIDDLVIFAHAIEAAHGITAAQNGGQHG